MAELPRQIHSGIVKIGNVDVEVVQLDNGMRLITEESTLALQRAGLMPAFLDVQETHKLTSEPQSIADQMMLKCACGWRKPVSTIEFGTRAALLEQAAKLWLEHVASDQALSHG
jgi:hypothetical protein